MRFDTIIGHKGAEKDGTVKFTIGRTTRMPWKMGVNTWAAFYGSPKHAIVDGDFVTFGGELQPVLKALRAADINVVAIDNHVKGETPRDLPARLGRWPRPSNSPEL